MGGACSARGRDKKHPKRGPRRGWEGSTETETGNIE